MIIKPLPFKGLNIRIPIKIPIKGRGFINQGSSVGYLLSRRIFSFPSMTVEGSEKIAQDSRAFRSPLLDTNNGGPPSLNASVYIYGSFPK